MNRKPGAASTGGVRHDIKSKVKIQKSKNSQHHLGGSSALSPYNYDDASIGYNFVKQVTSNYRQHYVTNAAKTTPIRKLMSAESYSYDHMGRRRSNASQLQDSTNTIQGAVRVSLASYNEIEQLTKKSLHSVNGTSNFLQNVDYRYNARGWMTNINNPALSADGGTTNTDLNDQFGMELKYDNAATPQYNGNIGSTTVKTTALSGITYPALVYNYSYDKLNRLTDAISTTTTAGDGFYNENLTYDPMGNIQTLKRYDKNGTAAQLIDNLNYIYVSGNKVDRIDDAGTTAGFNNTVSQAGEYTYDGNGNQLVDLNKGLTQAYNMLNLPQTAVKSGVSVAYIYDATGRKLRKLSTMGTTTTVTEYVGGIQYEYTGTYPVISFIQTEEGRARKSGTVYKYEYDLKDHLGDTRLTTTWDPSDVNQLTPLNLQRNDYYAFGYVIQSTAYSIFPKNEYLYNHKELQEETGLYDYGARFYDPVIGRWGAVDPLVEAGQESGTPYGYVFDDPMKFTDPDGRSPDITIDGSNNSSLTIKTDLINVRVNVDIDLHGNHTIDGEAAVQTGLDFVSLFDPTGITSVLSAGISAKNGDYLDAAMGVLGAIPIAGELAKAEKVAKDIKVIDKLIVDGEKAAKIAKAEARAAKLSKVAREGEDFTKAGKEAVHDLNAAHNDGKVICVDCKVETLPATQSKKGVKPSDRERHADHKIPKSKGGSGTPDNGESRCRACNIKKSDN